MLLAGASVCLIAGASVAAGAPAALDRAFSERDPAAVRVDPRSRLTSVYSNGRSDLWRVALMEVDERPFTGTGAGTFAHTWDRYRPNVGDAPDAHSLYVETLGELGIVGLALVLTFISTLLLAVVQGRRAARRLHWVAAVSLVMWAAHVGVEWLWEIPAASLAAIGLAGAAAATSGGRPVRRIAVRVPAALACVALAIVPAAEAVAQRTMIAATRAYNARDCATADSRARAAGAIAPWRSDAPVVTSLCAARRHDRTTALTAMEQAASRDPGDWRLLLDRAFVLAATGGDPRPALLEAVRRNPRGGEVHALWQLGRETPSAQWRELFRGGWSYIGGLPEMPIGPDELCVRDPTGYWRWTFWSQQHCQPTTVVHDSTRR
jgi:hypothetical protein